MLVLSPHLFRHFVPSILFHTSFSHSTLPFSHVAWGPSRTVSEQKLPLGFHLSSSWMAWLPQSSITFKIGYWHILFYSLHIFRKSCNLSDFSQITLLQKRLPKQKANCDTLSRDLCCVQDLWPMTVKWMSTRQPVRILVVSQVTGHRMLWGLTKEQVSGYILSLRFLSWGNPNVCKLRKVNPIFVVNQYMICKVANKCLVHSCFAVCQHPVWFSAGGFSSWRSQDPLPWQSTSQACQEQFWMLRALWMWETRSCVFILLTFNK